MIAEEYGDWADSHRRIDLLAIDRAANRVVIELKRTRDLRERVCIVLASAEFSREVTTSVLWLSSRGLDIRCGRAVATRGAGGRGQPPSRSAEAVADLPGGPDRGRGWHQTPAGRRRRRRLVPRFTTGARTRAAAGVLVMTFGLWTIAGSVLPGVKASAHHEVTAGR